MNLVLTHIVAAGLGLVLLSHPLNGAEAETKKISASELAGQLDTDRLPGTSFVRLRLEANKSVLQIQIKERRTKESIDLVYQVLFPKDRKGQAVLLQKTIGEPASGVFFEPPDTKRKLTGDDLRGKFFDSDLTYEDMVENFFAWKQQEIVGTEEINRVKCTILESKPAKSDHSSYGKVRTWVDTRRMVPLRVEKHLPSGEVARRIETKRVATGPEGRPIPANLTITNPATGSVTELDGSRIKHGVVYTDEEFTPEGLTQLQLPKGGSAEAPE